MLSNVSEKYEYFEGLEAVFNTLCWLSLDMRNFFNNLATVQALDDPRHSRDIPIVRTFVPSPAAE